MSEINDFTPEKVPSRYPEGNMAVFLRLYNANFQRMYIYAKTLLPEKEYVDDVMQEVSLSLWEKFPDFRSDSSFLFWAFGMIRIEILRWKRQRNRDFLPANETYLNAVADHFSRKSEEEIDRRYETLIRCTEKLPKKLHELIVDRYFKKESVSQIALKAKKSADAIYQQLCRARGLLRKCVDRNMDS